MQPIVSFLFLSGVEIQTHNLEGKPFLIQSGGLLGFWLADHAAQAALLPLLIVPFLPELFGLLQRFLQIFLIFCVVELVRESRSVTICQVPVIYLDLARANHDFQRFSKLCQVTYSSSESVQNGLGHVFVKLARSGNRDRVAVDHVKSFLVNGMLALGLRNFFLSRVAEQHLVKPFVGDETRPNFMIVKSLLSLIAEVFGDIEIRMLSWLDDIGINFESEGSKIAIVDASSTGDVLLNVLAQGPDDEMELRLGIKWFD